MARRVLTLGGGCFWCLEGVYQLMDGIETVESGYMGGPRPNPTYRDVCTGTSGHAEVVRLTYEDSVATTRDVLDVFFAIHDPTTRNRQGNDVGSQYRSAIFFDTADQQAAAADLIRELGEKKCYANGIVTEVEPASEFYLAENYHQNYFRDNSEQPYCQFVVVPKVKKFLTKYASRRKAEARE